MGVHDDDTVNAKRGGAFPLMNLHERVLSVLSCRHVDEVIIGAPWSVTQDLLTTMNVSVVVHGTASEPASAQHGHAQLEDAYAVPREMGILKQFTSPRPELSVGAIVDRIMSRKAEYEERFEKKAKKEAAYISGQKKFVAEQ